MEQLTNGREADKVDNQLQKFDSISVITESDIDHL